MANTFLFANLARSSLAGSINDVAVTLSVQAGGGAQFPSPTSGQQFAMTLTDAATGLLKEVVYVTNRTGDTMTVVRGQEGYTALNWAANDPIANLWTAGQAAAMAQQTQIQAQSPNYTTDIGALNAYIGAYTPSISVPVAGMPLRLKIANTNTAASTFNPGSGAASIVTGTGSALVGGELKSGLIYEFMWNGTNYELMGPVIAGLAAGSVIDYAGATAPAGWLLCYGQSLLRASFPDLFTAIGVVFGATDGSHFSLPDLRGRVVAGRDNMGGSAANILTTVMTPDGNTLGAIGGTQRHVLVTGELAAHAHTYTDPGHTHMVNETNMYQDAGGPVVASGALPAQPIQPTLTTNGVGITIDDTGSDAAHLNTQPSMIMNKIIKVYN